MVNRLDKIVESVNQRKYITVSELSEMFDVSQVTIRRDLQQLDDQNRIRRTRGGAFPFQKVVQPSLTELETMDSTAAGTFMDNVDVLITSSLGPYVDSIIMNSAKKYDLPIVAESVTISDAQNIVAVDDEAAGYALGVAIGKYAQTYFEGKAIVLDLTYHLINCQLRSKGFAKGIKEILPSVQNELSINAQSGWKTAYQVTRDAFQVNPEINIIFAINDATAFGAIRAAQDLGLDPDKVLVVPFGLEGDGMKHMLMEGEFCRIALAHFPEIVSYACIEMAVNVYQDTSSPHKVTTPFAILTPKTLSKFYQLRENNWVINWETVKQELDFRPPQTLSANGKERNFPKRIGLVVPHTEHDWYRNLVTFMQDHAADLGVDLEVIDAERHLLDEVTLRKRRIAEVAAEQVEANDAILLGDDQISLYLAHELAKKEDITVVTYSLAVFNILKDVSTIRLVLTGGVYDPEQNRLTGAKVTTSINELRTDKLFLTISGVTPDFALLTTLAEVDIKQAMLRSAREVILLADHTLFRQDIGAQFGLVTAVTKLITDNALPATIRLALLEREIGVIISDYYQI